jgi:hypothetical protein
MKADEGLFVDGSPVMRPPSTAGAEVAAQTREQLLRDELLADGEAARASDPQPHCGVPTEKSVVVRQLMLRPPMDTLLGDDVGASFLSPDPARICAFASRCTSPRTPYSLPPLKFGPAPIWHHKPWP